MKYDHPKHPNFVDWSAGLSDGGDTNPYREPGNRAGGALEAYHEGFDYALDGMEDYDPDFPI